MKTQTKAMKCPICRQGETNPGLVTVHLQRGETTVIFKQIPAEVCENCGEYYLTQSVTDRLLTRAEEAVKNGAEVEILRFAA
jgi:YgiT-type zinc finger domain-containing protein